MSLIYFDSCLSITTNFNKMKKKLLLLPILILSMGLVFTACEEEATDDCSSEMGDVADDFGCSAPVMPQICTVDGVDDHYILGGVNYPCDNDDCSNFPAAMIAKMQSDYGCSTKKSTAIILAEQKISKRAKEILARLKMESLCAD